jgi:FKBP-type peptidyl-prolyl cis-trans isomerase FkpA
VFFHTFASVLFKTNNMKPIILAILFLVVLAGCKKDEEVAVDCNALPSVTVPAGEITALQAYLTANGITATQHSSGLFYTIVTPGTGTVTPNQCSGVSVTYTGRLTTGATFDQATTAVSFTLSGLITAWRIGIPLIKAGGAIKLYVPPSLGYGSQAVGSIPANSILVFDIGLVNVQ